MENIEYSDEDPSSVRNGIENGRVLPWGAPNDRPNPVTTEDDITSGEFVLRTLFAEFTLAAEKKIEIVLAEPLERPLAKSLQRGEDPQFDQLLNSLSTVAEYSLLSLLKTLFQWYEKQQNIRIGDDTDGPKGKSTQPRPKSGADSPRLLSKSFRERDCLTERRDLAVDFLFCLVLIEILKQLHVHPVDDEYLLYIESLAFRHFKQRVIDSSSPSAANGQIIAALYAEVIGVLALAHFPSIRKRFLAEFKEHQSNPSTLINLIYGMKYLRIKLFPVEELEEGFLFMRECATLFIDAKEKEVKYALALMFVEILVPVAASANRELNVPALKNFVDMMFQHAFDMAKNRKHCQPIYPLVTILLCVSQKSFFLSYWPGFLTMCLTSLRQRDVKVQRVAMECLYRLVWVYVVRIKCESNTHTISRLRSIIEALFPRGSRTVVPGPKDVPLNIFVKIVHFIAQEKLDFAMNDIVFDLLGVGRSSRQISPERMNIGLRAFFVIADNLQRKGGEPPPMPSSISTLPSGNTVRIKKVTLPKTLTESAASNIGLANYYHSVRKALDSILRALDAQVGKPMVMTNPHCSHKEPDDMITGERKPKIDLFRTCIAAIPRCIPEGMTKTELVDLLSRLTVHMDEELRGLAFSSLQSLVLDFADWREDAVLGFVNFIMKEVQDNFPSLLDSGLRMLLQLLAYWKTAVSGTCDNTNKATSDAPLELSSHTLPSERKDDSTSVLHSIEGGALVMLCSTRPFLRKLALMVLKEVRALFQIIDPENKKRKEKTVMDVIEQVFPTVLESTLLAVPQSEKLFSGPLGNADMMVVNDRLSANIDRETGEQNLALHSDFWVTVLVGLLDKSYIPASCPSALQFSWPAVFNRLLNVYSIIDPGTSGMDSITSLSSVYGRGPKKITNMNDVRLWRNYLVFACCTHPTSHPSRSESPEQDGGAASDGADSKADSRPPSPCMVDSLFRFAIPLLKSDCSAIRDAVITALGRISPASYREFLEEIHFFIREALDRRAESLRKRRKKDSLRSYLTRVFELNAQYGIFSDSESGQVHEGRLMTFFVDYIEGIRLYLETEPDKDWPAIMNLRLYFCNFVFKLIVSVTSTSTEGHFLTKELRKNLFFLISSWCVHFGVKTPDVDRTVLIPSAQSNDLELASLNAMCALLQCGPMFDHNGLALGGYLYRWMETVLNSPKEKIHLLGHETLVRILEYNSNCPALMNWVIDKCYTGTKLVVSGCFKAVADVLTKRNDYPCDMISMLNVVLFKTADPCIDTREKAAQLLQILERRFFQYTPPSISCAAHCSYSQSQGDLSEALARAHPEITIHMFEEMTARFQSASHAGQRCILQYMLPWLANIELADLCNPGGPGMETDVADCEELEPYEILPPVELANEGWGSLEATHLVLNNLFYITVRYDELFSKEIETCWASLCSQWTNNIHEILNYLITLVGVVGHSEILVHAKKLAVYLARANSERTIEEIMEELKLTETIASQFERSDEPPYFRVISKTTCSRDSVVDAHPTKPSNAEAKPDEARQDGENNKKTLEEIGKRESREEKREKMEDTHKANSFEQGNGHDQLDTAPLAQPEDEEDDGQDKVTITDEHYWPQEWAIMVHRHGVPVPLPVPDRPKYYAPIADILPFASGTATLYRCNFALMLLTELVLDQAQEDWGRHLPLMLHVIFLGLDHGKALVYEHCKRLLINLVVILVCHGNYITVAEPLFKFMTVSEQGLKKHGGLQKSIWTLDLGSMVRESFGSSAGAVGQRTVCAGEKGESVDGNTSAGTNATESAAGSEALTDADEKSSTETNIDEQVKDLIEFLANSSCKALWAFEDITPRSYKIKSAEQMEAFLALVIHIFKSSEFGSELQEKWAKVGLQWATTCSSRHYAGRSFQVFRSLKVPLSWPMLSDVLARLVESVGDSSEDVQGYVMEILLTLEAATDWTMYDSSDPSNPAGRERVIPYSGTTNAEEKDHDTDELANVLTPLGASLTTGSPYLGRPSSWMNDFPSMRHYRSLSSGCDIRRALGFYSQFGKINNHSNEILSRARSASVQCLRMPSESVSPQSQTDMITRVFWIAVSLLESDYDHEYLMAIELLNQVLTFLNLGRIESRERIEKVLHRLKWTDFPGLQALLLKGLTSAGTYDASLRLLARLTDFSDVMIVDPSQVSGLGMNILALLPHMVVHFSEPDEFSRTCADNIVQVCRRSPGLANLGKMFTMFRDKSYHRPRNTWVEVVCKYIYDSFSRHSRTYLNFLLEVLERGPPSNQESVLSILWALMRLVDISTPCKRSFYNDALRVISKHIKGNYWKESLEILKFAVSNSSNLDTPPPRPASSIWSMHDSTWAMDALPAKKDLPGRTLAFTFDLSSTPVIGRRGTLESAEQVKDSRIPNDMAFSRKTHISQRRTRERLVTVLQTCGHNVGLKQSPSVVFSSSSDLAVEKPTDQQSSDEDLSNDVKDDQIMSVLTKFDFLDDVSEESSDESRFAVWPGEETRRESFDNLDVQALDKTNLPAMDSFSGSDQDLTTPQESSDDDDELNQSLNEGSVTTMGAVDDSEPTIDFATESSGTDHEVVIVVSSHDSSDNEKRHLSTRYSDDTDDDAEEEEEEDEKENKFSREAGTKKKGRKLNSQVAKPSSKANKKEDKRLGKEWLEESSTDEDTEYEEEEYTDMKEDRKLSSLVIHLSGKASSEVDKLIVKEPLDEVTKADSEDEDEEENTNDERKLWSSSGRLSGKTITEGNTAVEKQDDSDKDDLVDDHEYEEGVEKTETENWKHITHGMRIVYKFNEAKSEERLGDEEVDDDIEEDVETLIGSDTEIDDEIEELLAPSSTTSSVMLHSSRVGSRKDVMITIAKERATGVSLPSYSMGNLCEKVTPLDHSKFAGIIMLCTRDHSRYSSKVGLTSGSKSSENGEPESTGNSSMSPRDETMGDKEREVVRERPRYPGVVMLDYKQDVGEENDTYEVIKAAHKHDGPGGRPEDVVTNPLSKEPCISPGSRGSNSNVECLESDCDKSGETSNFDRYPGLVLLRADVTHNVQLTLDDDQNELENSSPNVRYRDSEFKGEVKPAREIADESEEEPGIHTGEAPSLFDAKGFDHQLDEGHEIQKENQCISNVADDICSDSFGKSKLTDSDRYASMIAWYAEQIITEVETDLGNVQDYNSHLTQFADAPSGDCDIEESATRETKKQDSRIPAMVMLNNDVDESTSGDQNPRIFAPVHDEAENMEKKMWVHHESDMKTRRVVSDDQRGSLQSENSDTEEEMISRNPDTPKGDPLEGSCSNKSNLHSGLGRLSMDDNKDEPERGRNFGSSFLMCSTPKTQPVDAKANTRDMITFVRMCDTDNSSGYSEEFSEETDSLVEVTELGSDLDCLEEVDLTDYEEQCSSFPVIHCEVDSCREKCLDATKKDLGSCSSSEGDRGRKDGIAQALDSTESAVGTSPSAKGEYQLYSVTERMCVSDEEVDTLWSDHVTSIIKDNTGVTAVNTYSLFWCLYKSARRKFYSLTRECCNYLDEKFKDVSQHFCNTLEFLVVRGDCPFVCLDTKTLRKSRMFDKQKFMTLELHDHYVNYIAKRDKTMGYLDCVKLALKRSSIGSHNDEPDARALDAMTHEQRQLELCQCLYQMHFQFLLLCNTYSRLLEALSKGAHNNEITDNTPKASTIRTEITAVLEHLPPYEDSPSPHTDLENLSTDTAMNQLVDKLLNKDIENAVHLLRAARKTFGGQVFGVSDEDNLDSLVTLYCKHMVERDMGTLAMSSPPTQFSLLCSDLMDVNVSALGALQDLLLPQETL